MAVSETAVSPRCGATLLGGAGDSGASARADRGAARSTSGGRSRSRATTARRAPAASRSACTPRSSRSGTRRSACSSRCSAWRASGGGVVRRRQRPVMIAGVGRTNTRRHSSEAEIALSLGYDAALLSLAALRDADNRRRARSLPSRRRRDPARRLLPPAGGRRAGPRSAFWRGFLDIERVVAIKVAPFDRYRTLDVVDRAGRERPARCGALHRKRRCDRGRPADAVSGELTTGLCISRRVARPVGRLDETRRRSSATLPRGHETSEAGGERPRRLRLLALGAAAHRRQRRAVRPGTSVRRLHSRHPRGSAPPGAARGTLVPRSAGGSEPGADGGDRPRARPLPAPDRRRVREGASATDGLSLTSRYSCCRRCLSPCSERSEPDAAPRRQAGVSPADLVLLDARIFTVDERFSTASALAVRGGRFVAVGSDDGIRGYIGSGTRVIQGRGRTVCRASSTRTSTRSMSPRARPCSRSGTSHRLRNCRTGFAGRRLAGRGTRGSGRLVRIRPACASIASRHAANWMRLPPLIPSSWTARTRSR